MTDRAPTQIVPVFNWLDPRAHPLGDTWLVTMFTVLLSVGLPRLASGLPIDFAGCAVGLLALAIIHVGFALAAGRMAAGSELRTRAFVVLHALGVVTLGLVWPHAGGLQNPLYLAVFVLPVIGAMFISRWQSYLTALLSAATVALLAAAQSPEPRPEVPVLSAAAAWLSTTWMLSAGVRTPAAFYAPSWYYAVLPEVFAVVVLGAALVTEYLRTVLDRLQAQVSMARSETLRSQGLWSALVEELPLPAALIDADTREVLGASALAAARWRTPAGAITGRTFFEVLKFSYPEPIEALIGGPDGVVPFSILRLGEQLIATEVRVQHLAQSGRRFALVTVCDTTEAFCVRAALDAAEHAAIVVDASGSVLVINRPARAVFPEAKAGTAVSQLVADSATGAPWWDPGLSRSRKLHLKVKRRVYRVTVNPIPLPGEEARLYVIGLMPAPGVEVDDHGAKPERGDETATVSLRALALGVILLACGRHAAADQAQPAPPLAPVVEDRVILSATGATLSGGSGGSGASALWSHTFAPADVLGAGAEYLENAGSHYTAGVLSGSLGLGGPAPTVLYTEAHEGAGNTGPHNFSYSVVAAGLVYPATAWLSAQLEERRIDVDTSHGNLPKASLIFHLAQPTLVTVSYADTAGGNLGTQLTTVRADYVAPPVSGFAGAAAGRASPAVLNLLGQVVRPGARLTELFAGAGRTFGHTDWQLVADYQDIEGFKRTSLTLLCTLHLDGQGRSP